MKAAALLVFACLVATVVGTVPPPHNGPPGSPLPPTNPGPLPPIPLPGAGAGNGACRRVGGFFREADGTFCKACVLSKGFYRNRQGQFCIGSCEIVSPKGAPIVRKDSVTGETCLPCLKGPDGKFRTADGKFCKQECLRDGWYSNDKTPSFRDTVTGQYCKPAAHGTTAASVQANLSAMRSRFAAARDPQNPAADKGRRSPFLKPGSCTYYGGYLRTTEGKFCASECILEDGYYRNKKGEFCVRPCKNNFAMTGAECAECRVDPRNKNVFRTKDGRFCEQTCLRDGWLRPGVPLFRDPVTGRFCKNKN